MAAPEPVIIAIIEDDEDLRLNIELFLRGSGYQVWGVPSAELFYKQLVVEPAELVLVDIHLPGEDGYSVISHLAAAGRYGIIAMTCNGGSADRIRGLSCGADMFFMKPLDLTELEAGIRAVIRRSICHGSTAQRSLVAIREEDKGQVWQLALQTSQLLAPDGKQTELTSREVVLLQLLMRAPGQTLDKNAIHAALGNHAEDDFHRVESLLYRLRKKVESVSAQKLPIRAVFGRGLVFAGNTRVI